jgi:hypothetical protein
VRVDNIKLKLMFCACWTVSFAMYGIRSIYNRMIAIPHPERPTAQTSLQYIHVVSLSRMFVLDEVA